MLALNEERKKKALYVPVRTGSSGVVGGPAPTAVEAVMLQE